MKILICGDSLRIGGAETHILGLALGLARLGHSVTVAADYGELCPSLFASQKSIGFVRIPFARFDPRNVITLARLIHGGGFDIVHAHSRPSALTVSLSRKLPVKDRFGFVTTAHAHYSRNTVKDMLSVWGDATIAVSDDIRSLLTERFALPNCNITVIANGVDTERFFPVKKDSDKSFNILFASRLDADCSLGAILLCRMAPYLQKTIHELKINIVGGGAYLDKIRAMARSVNSSIGKECVTVAGAAVDMPAMIANAALCVGVSRFALEAMAMKKCVILFGNEGALGLFTPSKKIAAAQTNFTARGCGLPTASLLFQEILLFWRMSDEKKKELSEYGYSTVIGNYTDSLSVKRTEAVYRSVLPHPTVTLGGYYGFNNIGDETVRSIISSSLAERLPNAEINVLTASPRSVNNGVDRHRPIPVIRSLIHSDIYICGGGSLLQSATSLRSLAYYCALISAAKLFGCRTVLASNGLGPLGSPISRAIARSALMRCDYVSVRDVCSYRLAQKLTQGKKKIHLSADPAFSLSPTSQKSNDGIAFSFREKELSIPLIRRALSSVDRNASVIYMPMDDQAPLPCYNANDIISLIGKCGGAVGSRLHFLIFAILSGIPFVAVGSDPKLCALSRMTLGLPSIDPSLFSSPDALASEIRKYLSLAPTFPRKEFIGSQKRLYLRDMDRIAALIKNI